MKYLTPYKLHESDLTLFLKTITNDLSEIEDCFLGVSDLLPYSTNSGLRINHIGNKTRHYLGKNYKSFNSEGDFEVMIIFKLDKYEGNDCYRKSNISEDIIYEIENSIDLIKGIVNLKLLSIAIECVNSINYDKGERGPRTECEKFDISIGIDKIFDFIRSKDDKVRWIKIFFEKN